MLCGWAALHAIPNPSNGLPAEHPASQELRSVVEEFENLGEESLKSHKSHCPTEHFERAAALALWHGNIALAVKILQRTIKANKATAAVVEAVANSRGAHKDDDLEEEHDATRERFIDELTPGIPPPPPPIPPSLFILHQITFSSCLLWRCVSLATVVDLLVASRSQGGVVGQVYDTFYFYRPSSPRSGGLPRWIQKLRQKCRLAKRPMTRSESPPVPEEPLTSSQG